VYCQRGQAANWIKQVKADLKSDRTSASSFLANFARLSLTAAAYVLHQQLRVLGLHDTELASAQPRTVILSLFKIAVASNSTKTGCCYTYPAPVRSRRYWQKSVNDSFQPAGNLPCRPFHDPARLAHETMPPPFPITSSRSTLSLGVGAISPENQKNMGAATKMFDGKFMQSSG
jgi:hypothetical protein